MDNQMKNYNRRLLEITDQELDEVVGGQRDFLSEAWKKVHNAAKDMVNPELHTDCAIIPTDDDPRR